MLFLRLQADGVDRGGASCRLVVVGAVGIEQILKRDLDDSRRRSCAERSGVRVCIFLVERYPATSPAD